MNGADRRPTSSWHRLAGPTLAVAAALALLAAEAWLRPLAEDGVHLQPWSSEEMMQSVSVEDLRREPVRSLWYLHLQPPGYDGIRALLALGSGERRGPELVEQVDRRLYVAWAGLFGLLGWMVYRWLAELTRPSYALAAALVLLLHPATLFYATLLETTLLSALLFTLLIYLLWRAREEATASPGALAAVFVALYLTRSLVQWPWLFVLAASLWAIRYPRRPAIRVVVVATLAVALFTVKQQALFGIWTTSSLGWMNLCRSVQGCEVGDPWNEILTADSAERESTSPRVLTRRRKLDPNRTANLNHASLLARGERWRSAYFARLREMSPAELAHNYAVNLHVYLSPSSRYTRHVLVDRLPYRRVYDTVFSGRLLLALLALAAIHWLVRRPRSAWRSTLGLLLPIGVLALLGIVAERIENMRFKFFVEPMLFVFLAGELYHAACGVAGRFRARWTREPRAVPVP